MFGLCISPEAYDNLLFYFASLIEWFIEIYLSLSLETVLSRLAQ